MIPVHARACAFAGEEYSDVMCLHVCVCVCVCVCVQETEGMKKKAKGEYLGQHHIKVQKSDREKK